MNGRPTHEETARRLEALKILESIEELAWAANRRNETIPQTRLYFEKILAGYNPDTPEPEYDEAVWGDEVPPAPEIGVDPRTTARRSRTVKEEATQVKEEVNAQGRGTDAMQEQNGPNNDAGDMRRSAESRRGQEQDRERMKDEAAVGGKRKWAKKERRGMRSSES